MDLTDYIDFDVTFDLTGDEPVVSLKDTGNYPAGVPQGITGSFLVIQPDGADPGNTDFSNVKWDAVASALTTYKYAPRGSCDGTIQNGTWEIIYTVRVAGYTDTILKKTFYYNFFAPVADIQAVFDVFTPSLVYKDITDYSASGWTASIARAWSVNALDAARTLTGSDQNLDLRSNSNYYDSRYQATMTATVTYTNNTSPYLSTVVKLVATDSASANTPPSCKDLMNQLQTFADICECQETNKSYPVAAMLLKTINTSMANANYVGLYELIEKYENYVLGSYSYVNTGAAIPAFNYDCGTVVTVNTGKTQVIGSNVLDFKVGDDGYPQGGDTTFAHADLYQKSISYFSRGNVLQSAKAGDYTYNPDNGNAQGEINVTNQFSGAGGGERVMIGLTSKTTADGIAKDGVSSYMHIRYSNDGGITFTANNGKTVGDYLGIYSDTNADDSTSVNDYQWIKIVGARGSNGANGTNGVDGTDGQTTYVHIKYSNDGGVTLTGGNGSDPGAYIGVRTDFNSEATLDPTAYSWAALNATITVSSYLAGSSDL